MANTSRKRKQPTTQSIFRIVADMMSRDEGKANIDVRFQRGSEMSRIARIDELCFGESAWTEEKLLRKSSTNLYVLKVAVRNDEVVGYMAYKLNTDHIRLVRLAVLPSERRTGVGVRLVEHLKEKMGRVKYLRSVVCDVPDDCLPVQLLLRNTGFRAVEILRTKDSEFYRMIHPKNSGEPNHDTLSDAGGDRSAHH